MEKEKKNTHENTMKVSEVRLGMRVVCTDFLERLVKNPQDGYDTRYIVKITGVVTGVRNSEVEIKVEQVTSENLRRQGSAWMLDDSVFKRPPYNPGDVYVCKLQKKIIENLVYKGRREIYLKKLNK